MDETARLDILTSSLDEKDALRKKLAMDALKTRLGSGPDADKKLREACEGFESIFIGKLWQQMRQTVPKEGYLHSKEEDMYLSMFDTEMAKKMASAGGMGLGDMLYRQLKESSTQASRTAAPSSMAEVKPLQPLRMPQAHQAQGVDPAPQAASETQPATPDLQALYTPLEGYDAGYAGAAAVEVAEPSKAEPPTAEVLGRVEALARSITAASAVAIAADDTASSRVLQAEDPASAMPLINDVSPPEQNQEGDIFWPVSGEIVSGFGWQADPLSGGKRWHPGVDIAGSQGDPVAACWDGRVIFADETKEFGNLVIVEHPGGWQSSYGNNSSLNVGIDDLVQAGQKIAQMGSTGQSTDPHLYFELRRDGVAVDPVRTRRRLLAGAPVLQASQERG